MSVADRVLRIVTELARGERAHDINEQDSLRDDLGFDSMRLMALLIQLEEEFARFFTDDELANIRIVTVGDLIGVAASLSE